MNILLTNDDGIQSEGLHSIYKKLIKLGNVTIVAPDSERSAISHAITLNKPLFSSKYYKKNKFFGTALSGTPADCVKFAIRTILKKKPDLIVSGINLGPNDGCSVFYSGTAAAARDGALSGIPSIAISLATFVNPDFSYASEIGIKIAKQVIKNKIPKGTFLNINIPNKNPKNIKGIKITKQCRVPIHSEIKRYRDPDNREYFWLCGREPNTQKDLSLDTYALNNGFVTVTPIQTDATDYTCLQSITNWNIK